MHKKTSLAGVLAELLGIEHVARLRGAHLNVAGAPDAWELDVGGLRHLLIGLRIETKDFLDRVEDPGRTRSGTVKIRTKGMAHSPSSLVS